MPLFNNIEASFTGAISPYIGSFWTSRFQQKDQVANFLSLTLRNKSLGMFRETVANLMGDADLGSLEKYVEETFNAKSVFISGQLLFDDPDVNKFYQPEANSTEAYNQDSTRYYVLPVKDYIPRLIQATNARLVLGIDFFLVKEKWIFFRQDPRILFPDNRLKMPLAERVHYKPLVSFLLRAAIKDNIQYVLQYYRQKQTPEAFCLALAAVGGLQIIHFDQKLLSIRNYLGTTVYTFEQETIRVSYEHDLLVVGQSYKANQIIGDGIEIYFDKGDGVAWWRQVDWGAGLSLDPILKSFSGLALLDRETVAYASGSDSGSVDGSKLHTRVKLSDNFYAEKPYWDWVATRETLSGNYMNNLPMLQLDDEPTSEQAIVGYNYSSIPFLILNFEDYLTVDLSVGVFDDWGQLVDTITTFDDYGLLYDDSLLPYLYLIFDDWLTIDLSPSDLEDYGMLTDIITTFEDYGLLFAESVAGAASVPVFTNVSDTFAKLLNEYAEANALNAQLGWPTEQPDVESLPDTKRVNALDLFFSAVLQKKGMAIVINREQISNLNFFYKFLKREMIAGVIPIIFSRGEALDVESLDVGVTIGIDDSAVVMTPSAPITLLESVDLPSIMSDTILFT